MRLDIYKQIRTDASFPLDPVHVPTGSALPIQITSVPYMRGDKRVTGVKVKLTNADGITVEAACARFSCDCYRVVFNAENFINYGMVDNGVIIILILDNGQEEKVAMGILDVIAGSANAQPGVPSNHYQTKGDDEYHKSYVENGVQHFKKVEIAYDENMEAWGFNLVGDYVLSSDGDFIPVNDND